jgi:hypothetical protein
MWTRSTYLSWRVLLMFYFIIAAYPPEDAMLCAFTDYKHSLSSDKMNISSFSLCTSWIWEHEPIGLDIKARPSSLPESGRNPMGDIWTVIPLGNRLLSYFGCKIRSCAASTRLMRAIRTKIKVVNLRVLNIYADKDKIINIYKLIIT